MSFRHIENGRRRERKKRYAKGLLDLPASIRAANDSARSNHPDEYLVSGRRRLFFTSGVQSAISRFFGLRMCVSNWAKSARAGQHWTGAREGTDAKGIEFDRLGDAECSRVGSRARDWSRVRRCASMSQEIWSIFRTYFQGAKEGGGGGFCTPESLCPRRRRGLSFGANQCRWRGALLYVALCTHLCAFFSFFFFPATTTTTQNLSLTCVKYYKMRLVKTERKLNIPDGVTVKMNGRYVSVTGPRGELHRDFNHIAKIDLHHDKENNTIVAAMYFPTSKITSALRTTCSHISNMFDGVLYGYEYKMRAVYAHFPININIDEKKGDMVEIRNFLGEKRPRKCKMLPGVKAERSSDVKDQIVLTGNDIDNVSKSCALIHDSCLVKKKDIRKFLDGMYVSEKRVMKPEDE